MTGIEADVHEIRQQVVEISKKPDILPDDQETPGIMKLRRKRYTDSWMKNRISAAWTI